MDAAVADKPTEEGFIEGYGAEDQPLAARITLMSAFGASVAAVTVLARATGHTPPERLSASDIVLTGVATHKLSRLITKAKVTSPVRAPFTKFQGATGKGEVAERPRGRGMRRAVGELLVCPYCLSQWISVGFMGGLVMAPRATRLVAGAYTAQALADFLQVAYLAAEKRS